MASVPGRYIKFAPIDWDGELFAAFGLPFRFPGGLTVPPAPFGVWAMLEIIDSRWIKSPASADLFDVYRALYICVNGSAAAPMIQDWLANGGREQPPNIDNPDTWTDFDKAVFAWGTKNLSNSDQAPDVLLRFYEFLALSFSGYAMIPGAAAAASEYIYGADTIGAVVAAMGDKLNLTPNKIIWETPAALIGHVAAQTAKQNGVKGVGRPKDINDMKRQFKMANERDEKGELHPWQIDDPLFNPPNPKQIKARPDITSEHARLVEKFQEINNHKKYIEWAKSEGLLKDE